MSFYNYYKILGVPMNASQDQIKTAFRDLAVKYHPDKNPGNPQAEEAFKVVSQAYEVLGDPEKKKVYDLKFVLLLTAIRQKLKEEDKKPDRRKYGISKRIFKPKEQEVAEQIAAYEIKMRRFSFYQRAFFHGFLAFLCWLWAFRNWYATVKEIEYAAIILGIMGFAVAMGFLFSDIFFELNYRHNRNLIAFNFEKWVMRWLSICVLAGICILVPMGQWRFNYHLTHYPVHTIGEVEAVNDFTIEFHFESPEGTIHKIQDLDTEFQNELITSGSIPVIYSSENPKIAKAILPKVE